MKCQEIHPGYKRWELLKINNLKILNHLKMSKNIFGAVKVSKPKKSVFDLSHEKKLSCNKVNTNFFC